MWASIIGQLLTLFIALAALWKDWTTYGAISKRIGRRLPILLAVGVVLIVAFNIWQTLEAEKREAKSAGRIEELGNQMKRNEESAERRAKQQSESFQATVNRLYARLSDLQTKMNTDPLLRQNRALLKELQDIRAEVKSAKAHLEKPPAQAGLIATFGDKVGQPDMTEISVPRQDDGTVECTIYIVNRSNVQARDGSIFVRLCKKCSFAREPERFVKAVGAHDYERVMNFQAIGAGTALSIPLKIKPPPMASRGAILEISVMARCENCTVVPSNQLYVNIR